MDLPWTGPKYSQTVTYPREFMNGLRSVEFFFPTFFFLWGLLEDPSTGNPCRLHFHFEPWSDVYKNLWWTAQKRWSLLSAETSSSVLTSIILSSHHHHDTHCVKWWDTYKDMNICRWWVNCVWSSDWMAFSRMFTGIGTVLYLCASEGSWVGLLMERLISTKGSFWQTVWNEKPHGLIF